MDTKRSDSAQEAQIRRYITLLGLVGSTAVVATAASAAGLPAPLTFVAIVALAALGDVEFLAIRHGETANAFNCSEAVLVGALVFVGPWAPLAGTIGVIAHQIGSRRDPLKRSFNVVSYATSTAAATAVFLTVADAGAPDWAALAAAAAIYYVVNLSTVAYVISLASGRRVSEIFGESRTLSAGVAMGNATIAILVSLTAVVQPMVLVTVPLLLIQLIISYRNTRAVTSERDVWVRLQDVSSRLIRSAPGKIAPVVLDAMGDLLNAELAEIIVIDPSGGARCWTRTADGAIEETAGTVEDLGGADWQLLEDERSTTTSLTPNRGVRSSPLTSPTQSELLLAPLAIGDDLVGLLRARCDGLANDSVRAASVLTNLASQTASALASERLIHELRHAADHDALTGLPNRTHLLTDLRATLTDARTLGFKVSVLFFDLDRFKVINDSLGHHFGDQLLVAVADRVRAVVRNEDLVARFGGDEFIVVCTGPSAEPAVALAERIVASLNDPVEIDGRRTSLSVCVGIAADDGVGDAESLLRDADAAMYAAKGDGPATVRSFTPEMRETVLTRLELDTELRKALDAGEIEVVFQPIVDLETGDVVELEALARWTHARLGPISPVDFIPVAEESGQIRRLGATVLETACRQLREWQEIGLGGPKLRVAVNISAVQVDEILPSVVAETLRRTGLAPECLSLEVTESALVAGADAVRVLAALRRAGVSIALDDFGTGFSSLSTLRDLPVETLKIDRSFVSRMGTPDDDAMVRGILGLADALGLDVVAEGIETAAEATQLRAFGCTRGQGWHFGRPVASPLVDPLLRTEAEVVPIRSRRDIA